MTALLHAQIQTLRKYQAWRTGKDGRTAGEAGIVPSAVTIALDAVIAIAENHLRDGMKKAEPVIPKGFRLIAVNDTFDSLMFWLDRCEQKGHLENCADLTEPWEKFEYREVEAPQPAEPVKVPSDDSAVAGIMREVDRFHDNNHVTIRMDIEGRIRALLARYQGAQPAASAGPNPLDWKSINAAIDEYADGYELRGEPGDHTPTEFERFLIVDAINGLLAEPEFLELLAAPLPPRPSRLQTHTRRTDMSVEMEMPRYVSHKQVWALKIKAIEPFGADGMFARLHFEDPRYAPIAVDADWYYGRKPEAGGYYVVYKDGYTSYSPAKAFDEGYTPENAAQASGHALTDQDGAARIGFSMVAGDAQDGQQ